MLNHEFNESYNFQLTRLRPVTLGVPLHYVNDKIEAGLAEAYLGQ